MKRISIILTAILMLSMFVTGCGSKAETTPETLSGDVITSSEATESNEPTENPKPNHKPSKADSETITLDSGIIINKSYNKDLMKTVKGNDYTIGSADYNFEDYAFGFGVKMDDTMQVLFDSGNLVWYPNSDRVVNVISYNYLTESEKNFQKDDKEKILSKAELLEKYAGKFENAENGTFAFAALFKYEKGVTGLSSLYTALKQDYKTVEKICEYGNNTYYLCYNSDYSGVTMTADEKTQADKLIAALPTIKENLYIYLTK